jgi:hypothetical protein
MDHGDILNCKIFSEAIMAFPPVPVYPQAIDSDYTLYLVYDTTETRLAVDNSAWSQEIDIVPVAADKPEIWADNGFGNIEGELFYYDSVELNENGKVTKLKGCARQLGGDKTQFNKKGTWVRSYVVAEHHNQLVMGIMKTQNFIGYNFDPRRETLDWRIRNLQALEVIFDDFNCPDVNFTWNILENDPVRGVLAEYVLEITPPGTISSFRLDFGDGEFTTSALSGQHRYAVNSRVDPVVRVANDKCQIIQTPIERINPAEPPAIADEVFEIPIPEFPTVPDFTFVPCEVPEPEINLPPLVVPCISIEGQVGPIPSVIVGPNINMVSNVTITSNNPIQILYSNITITGPNIPSLIIVDTPPIPPTIIIDPPIPPTIIIVPPESTIAVSLDLAEMPRLEVDWGTPPEMEVAMTFARPVQTPQRFAADESLMAEFGEEFADLFESKQTMKVEYEPVGIPSEIKVIMPEDTSVKLDTSELDNRKILIDASSVNLPKDIVIHGPESPIPNSIVFDASDLNQAIERLQTISPIKLDASDIPKTIKIEMEKEIPNTIVVEMPKPIPEKIVVESNIPDKIVLEGPTGIPLLLPEEFALPIKFPDKMPEVELVWKGSPIEVKITMDQIISQEADGRQCVMIVPCKP